MSQNGNDLPYNNWLLSPWLAAQLRERGWDWAQFGGQVEKPGRSIRRLELHLDAPPPCLRICCRIARVLDVSPVVVLWRAWVKSPIGLALQTAHVTALFGQLPDEEQEALLEEQRKLAETHKREIESDG